MRKAGSLVQRSTTCWRSGFQIIFIVIRVLRVSKRGIQSWCHTAQGELGCHFSRRGLSRQTLNTTKADMEWRNQPCRSGILSLISLETFPKVSNERSLCDTQVPRGTVPGLLEVLPQGSVVNISQMNTRQELATLFLKVRVLTWGPKKWWTQPLSFQVLGMPWVGGRRARTSPLSPLWFSGRRKGEATCLKENYVASGIFMVYRVLKDKTQNDVNKFVSHYTSINDKAT